MANESTEMHAFGSQCLYLIHGEVDTSMGCDTDTNDVGTSKNHICVLCTRRSHPASSMSHATWLTVVEVNQERTSAAVLVSKLVQTDATDAFAEPLSSSALSPSGSV